MSEIKKTALCRDFRVTFKVSNVYWYFLINKKGEKKGFNIYLMLFVLCNLVVLLTFKKNALKRINKAFHYER